MDIDIRIDIAEQMAGTDERKIYNWIWTSIELMD